jgi:periplasmic protein TonB
MNGHGSFAGCLVDGDAEMLKRARRLRRKALAISLIFEAVLIGAMLVSPLITPGVLPRQYVMMPTPPYGPHAGGNAERPKGESHPPPRGFHPPRDSQFYQPPTIPHHAQESALDEPGLDIGTGRGDSSGDSGAGVPGGTGIPDGLGVDTRAIPPPPTVPAPSAPVKMSEGVMEAQLIHRVQPVYPAVARTMHLSGMVQLRAIIGTDGRVRQMEVLSGHPILARAAVEAVNEWRYRPTLLSGKEVEVETLITVNFILDYA